jgi:hypothetical protein
VLLAASASNAAWATGFSAWGGATNFASESLRTSGLSGSTIAETRNTIVKDVREQIKIAMDGNKTYDERANAILQARANCILYEIAVPTIPTSNASAAKPASGVQPDPSVPK